MLAASVVPPPQRSTTASTQPLPAPAAPDPASAQAAAALLTELAGAGALAPFIHVDLFPRSREELLLRVRHSQAAVHEPWALPTPLDLRCAHNTITGVAAALCAATRTPATTPASASQDNSSPTHVLTSRTGRTHYTLFLIACYARYGRPHVWTRSALPTAGGLPVSGTDDRPLVLNSTAIWPFHPPQHTQRGSHYPGMQQNRQPSNTSTQIPVVLADIIAEVIGLVNDTHNPFAVDLPALRALPMQDRVLRANALMIFLSGVCKVAPYPFLPAVVCDLRELASISRTASDAIPIAPPRSASLPTTQKIDSLVTSTFDISQEQNEVQGFSTQQAPNLLNGYQGQQEQQSPRHHQETQLSPPKSPRSPQYQDQFHNDGSRLPLNAQNNTGFDFHTSQPANVQTEQQQAFAPPPPAQQSFDPPPPSQQSFAPPPPAQQSFAPPPSSQQSFAPPPTAQQSFAPPPSSHQSFAPPPTAQQSFGQPPTSRQSPTNQSFEPQSSTQQSSMPHSPTQQSYIPRKSVQYSPPQHPPTQSQQQQQQQQQGHLPESTTQQHAPPPSQRERPRISVSPHNSQFNMPLQGNQQPQSPTQRSPINLNKSPIHSPIEPPQKQFEALPSIQTSQVSEGMPWPQTISSPRSPMHDFQPRQLSPIVSQDSSTSQIPSKTPTHYPSQMSSQAPSYLNSQAPSQPQSHQQSQGPSQMTSSVNSRRQSPTQAQIQAQLKSGDQSPTHSQQSYQQQIQSQSSSQVPTRFNSQAASPGRIAPPRAGAERPQQSVITNGLGQQHLTQQRNKSPTSPVGREQGMMFGMGSTVMTHPPIVTSSLASQPISTAVSQSYVPTVSNQIVKQPLTSAPMTNGTALVSAPNFDASQSQDAFSNVPPWDAGDNIGSNFNGHSDMTNGKKDGFEYDSNVYESIA